MRINEDFREFTSGGGLVKKFSTIFLNPNFKAVLNYRISNFLYKHNLAIFSKLIWYYNRIKYAVDIDYRADLAGGLFLIHGIGTVIGRSVKTEGPIKIYQGVTIGGSGKIIEIEGKKVGMPIIGKNVTIACNASVLGPIRIKDTTFIKAHSLVSKDIL